MAISKKDALPSAGTPSRAGATVSENALVATKEQDFRPLPNALGRGQTV